jgi:phosphatidyl-myo-inositol dimannoside synthase
VWSLNDLAEKRGWSIRVLALHDHAARDSSSKSDLRRVRHSGFEGSKVRFSLQAIFESRKADVVLLAHVHFAPLLHIMRRMAPRASFRVSAHGIEVWKRLPPRTVSALRSADEVWAVSDYTRRRMLAENPQLDGAVRFTCLPNTLGPAYPSAKIGQGRESLGLPADAKVILCVSRMSSEEPYKNVEHLIRSMPRILERHPGTIAVLVGPGDDRERLERVVHHLNLTGSVRFAGRVCDDVLQSYFASSDLFVLPSTGEGFGIVFLEAMYHGKACIGAAAGGVPEVIEDGVTGILVDPAKPEALPTAIIRALQDDERRAAMGQAGKKRLTAEFSIERFRERVEELLSGSV